MLDGHIYSISTSNDTFINKPGKNNSVHVTQINI